MEVIAFENGRVRATYSDKDFSTHGISLFEKCGHDDPRIAYTKGKRNLKKAVDVLKFCAEHGSDETFESLRDMLDRMGLGPRTFSLQD